jgi:hypothetical protein
MNRLRSPFTGSAVIRFFSSKKKGSAAFESEAVNKYILNEGRSIELNGSAVEQEGERIISYFEKELAKFHLGRSNPCISWGN